jgi:hypothetical protein
LIGVRSARRQVSEQEADPFKNANAGTLIRASNTNGTFIGCAKPMEAPVARMADSPHSDESVTASTELQQYRALERADGKSTPDISGVEHVAVILLGPDCAVQRQYHGRGIAALAFWPGFLITLNRARLLSSPEHGCAAHAAGHSTQRGTCAYRVDAVVAADTDKVGA